MKRNTHVLLGIVFFLLLFGGCKKEEIPNVDSTPTFTTFESDISSLPGERFVITGTIEDPAGIKTVDLIYEAWDLKKTIIKDSLPKTYELAYGFKVPNDAVLGSSHSIEVIAGNAGEKTVSRMVTVTLDRDNVNPTITVNSPLDQGTFLISALDRIEIDIDLNDARGLESLDVSGPSISETIALSGTDYNYKNEVPVNEVGEYKFSFTVTDQAGNSTKKDVKVFILDELSFTTMFITDETSDAGLNNDLFGVPYITTPSLETDESGYVFTGRFYADKANTEVRFTPQEGSFSPYAFGAGTDGSLELGSDVTVAPIVLPEVGYYEVKMDLRNLSYSVTPYVPADETFEQVYILGTGITVNGKTTCEANDDGSLLCWHFRSGKPFTPVASNPNLWTLEATLGEEPLNDGVNGFIFNANPAGWSPFWRLDSGTNPQATVFNGGENYTYEPEDYGDYSFTFDTHLNRMAIRKKQ